MVHSPDGETDLFNIVTQFLQDGLLPICLYTA